MENPIIKILDDVYVLMYKRFRQLGVVSFEGGTATLK